MERMSKYSVNSSSSSSDTTVALTVVVIIVANSDKRIANKIGTKK